MPRNEKILSEIDAAKEALRQVWGISDRAHQMTYPAVPFFNSFQLELILSTISAQSIPEPSCRERHFNATGEALCKICDPWWDVVSDSREWCDALGIMSRDVDEELRRLERKGLA